MTNDRSVRVLHVPTGTEVTVDVRNSQFQNKKLALQWLRAKIWAKTNVLPPETEFTYIIDGEEE